MSTPSIEPIAVAARAAAQGAAGGTAYGTDRVYGRNLRVLLVLWVVMMLYPWLAPSSYVVGLGVTFFINLILVASLNLLMGYCGQISLCHSGFFGLGAYVSGVLSAKYGVPVPASMFCALALTGLAAALVGLPALRLRGHYLAMATLGLNAILSVLFVELVDLTGGPNGLSSVPPIGVAGHSLDSDTGYFYFAWAVGLLTMWGILNLVHSRVGRAMSSLVDSEIGAASLGVDTRALKVAVFAISATLAALAGTLYVHYTQFASPETFNFSASVLLVVIVAVGGWGKYWGPLYGALVFTAVPEILLAFPDVQLLLFGLGMIVVLVCFPGGIAGACARLAALARRRTRAGERPIAVRRSQHG